jgi:hypothetical protein
LYGESSIVKSGLQKRVKRQWEKLIHVLKIFEVLLIRSFKAASRQKRIQRFLSVCFNYQNN